MSNYDFEIGINKELDESLNSSFYLQLHYDNETKEIYIGTESSSPAKYNCATIRELINDIKEYCYNYLDYGEEYRIEYWETDWHRDAGEGIVYDKIFLDFDQAINKARELYYNNDYSSIEILNKNGKSLFCCDDLSENFYFNNNKISLVDERVVKEYIDNWSNNTEQSFNGYKLYCKANDKFVAIDNSTGDCFVEEFKSERETQKWLLGNELTKESDYEI